VANLTRRLNAAGVRPFELAHITLPLGISFFTFHAMSYVIDVYRRNAPAQRNPLNIAMYLSLFPQLIAGPIVRYKGYCRAARRKDRDRGPLRVRHPALGAWAGQEDAHCEYGGPASGTKSSCCGRPDDDRPGVAGRGVLRRCRFYFDLSGYSDMAVGIGRNVRV